MRTIKDTEYDEEVGVGRWYLIVKCGAEIELIDALIKSTAEQSKMKVRWTLQKYGDQPSELKSPLKQLAILEI